MNASPRPGSASGSVLAPAGDTIVCGRFDRLGFDDAPRRLGVMGGTFDPVHVGHLACAEQAREAFGLDAVVFVPAGRPAFKLDREIASAQDRLAMCRLAVSDNPYFDVSAIELEREGVTYSIDTVHALRAHYPACVELFFILGADAFASIEKWHDSAALASLVRFIVAERPGYRLDDAYLAHLAESGPYRVNRLETTALSVSSSGLRERIARGLSPRYLTTPDVCAYIEQRGLYRRNDCDIDERSIMEDVLGDEFIERMRAELAGRVSKKRFAHIEGVARAADKLAKVYGVDRRRARLAGLLHDWDKGYDDDGIRARVEEVGLSGSIDPWVVENMPQVLHGMTAAAALSREHPSIPADVIQAIDRHTTAAVDMTPLDMVVYIADAIEEGRKFGRIDELRAAVGKVDLEELFFETYGYWVFLLLERRRRLHPATITIWNTYAARAAARKGKQ